MVLSYYRSNVMKVQEVVIEKMMIKELIKIINLILYLDDGLLK